MKILTSAEAQNNFGELLDAAQRAPVTITRRGRTVAFILSPTEYEALCRGVVTQNTEALRAQARKAIAAFRGRGRGGGVGRLLADRRADRLRER